jgi:catechol 2,3-dioxygenase-like lactoylglutathione lyase family enzyme
MNLNHVHLHFDSVKDGAAFYTRYFGMHEHVWHGDMVFLRDGAGMDLAIAPGGAAAMPDWFHIGFRLSGHAAVKALHDRMQSDGVTIREPLQKDGDFSYFRCADPGGYMIEIYYEPDPA